MNLVKIAKAASIRITKNLPTIMVWTGLVGMGATTVLACKATIDISENDHLTKKDLIKDVAPVVGIGIASASLILIGNHKNVKLIKSFQNAYKSLNNLVDPIGPPILGALGTLGCDKYIQERKDDTEERWFYDEFSDTYFKSNWEHVLYAEIDSGKEFSMTGILPLNHHNERLGFILGSYSYPDEIGWDIEHMYEAHGITYVPIEYDDFNGKFDGSTKEKAIRILYPIPPHDIL